MKKENPMRRIYVEKVTVHICTGEPGEKLDKAIELLRRITGMEPKIVKAKRRIKEWGIRPGLPIGAKVTLRREKIKEILPKLLEAIKRRVKISQIDRDGNLSFGIEEYISIPGIKYDPKIGMMGMDICITLARPGYRVKKRKRARSKIGKSHKITKEEAIEFYKKELGLIIEE